MKKWYQPTRLQWHSFLASMPVISVLLNNVLFGQRFFREPGLFIGSFLLIFAIGVLSWRGHVVIGNWIKHRYPSIKQTRTRILILALCIIPFMSISILLIVLLYDQLSLWGFAMSADSVRFALILGFCVNLIFETLYEADFVFERYKETVEEKRSMQQLSLMNEFDSLKNQVNPHFLFNCFNTLSSLIAEDRKKAERFLNELSKVYRYLLRSNEDGLSTVENEIRFIKSYYQLLQTRHGEAVQLHIEIDKRYDQYLLPSLSLQLLVENVVKHNVLSKNKPLVIDIFTPAGNKLVVNNNLQRRSVKAPSNKVGLENIKAKYQLLGQQGFQVMEDGKNFTVVLPLIWSNTSELKRNLISESKSS